MKAASLRLSQILRHLPDRQRDEQPPYLRTLALLDALERCAVHCELWNAVIESPWKIQVVSAVRMGRDLMDWHGLNPNDYPRIYPIFLHGSLSRQSGHEIIPGKRLEAVKRYPEVHEQVQLALEWVYLEAATAQARAQAAVQRL